MVMVLFLVPSKSEWFENHKVMVPFLTVTHFSVSV